VILNETKKLSSVILNGKNGNSDVEHAGTSSRAVGLTSINVADHLYFVLFLGHVTASSATAAPTIVILVLVEIVVAVFVVVKVRLIERHQVVSLDRGSNRKIAGLILDQIGFCGMDAAHGYVRIAS